MARIRQRRGRHFIDENGRLYWINGPECHCYLSEQRQWRAGLSFDDVLDWKQCAPSGVVSQRFRSPREACEAFEHGLVHWSTDLYLRRMGDQMQLHRSPFDYKPTAMARAEACGAPVRRQPWLLPDASGPVCGLPPRQASAPPVSTSREDVVHAKRRRRGCASGAAELNSPAR
ncbi:MAG: hypothetical protein VKN17_03460 [Cyanobacteriota bacterium]|jgi:hypothetical protein|nr:hypothetical protein [Cyanobacteriota bacterium]